MFPQAPIYSASALTFLIAALAAPPSGARPAEAGADSALVNSHLFVCTDFNFGGQCTNLGFFRGACNNVSNGFQDNISSSSPDAGCITYTDFNCQGSTYTGSKPGFSTLPPRTNDAISSFQCLSP